jgi:hypothetical protein
MSLRTALISMMSVAAIPAVGCGGSSTPPQVAHQYACTGTGQAGGVRIHYNPVKITDPAHYLMTQAQAVKAFETDVDSMTPNQTFKNVVCLPVGGYVHQGKSKTSTTTQAAAPMVTVKEARANLSGTTAVAMVVTVPANAGAASIHVESNPSGQPVAVSWEPQSTLTGYRFQVTAPAAVSILPNQTSPKTISVAAAIPSDSSTTSLQVRLSVTTQKGSSGVIPTCATSTSGEQCGGSAPIPSTSSSSTTTSSTATSSTTTSSTTTTPPTTTTTPAKKTVKPYIAGDLHDMNQLQAALNKQFPGADFQCAPVTGSSEAACVGTINGHDVTKMVRISADGHTFTIQP